MRHNRWLFGVLALMLSACSLAPGVITVRASMGTYSIKFDTETRVRSALIVSINNTRPPRAGDTYRISVSGPGYNQAKEYTITQSSTGVARSWFGNDQDADFKDGRFAVTAALDNNQLGSNLTPEINRNNRLEPPNVVITKSSDSLVSANWQGVPDAALYYVRLNRIQDGDSIDKVVDFYTKSTSVNFNNLSLEEGPTYFVSINAFNTDIIPGESWNNLPAQFNVSYSNSTAFTIKRGGLEGLGFTPRVVVE